MQYARCSNLGNCDNADNRTLIALPDDADLICPICQHHLTPVEPNRPQSWKPAAVLIGAVIMLLCIGYAVDRALTRKAAETVHAVVRDAVPTDALRERAEQTAASAARDRAANSQASTQNTTTETSDDAATETDNGSSQNATAADSSPSIESGKPTQRSSAAADAGNHTAPPAQRPDRRWGVPGE